MSQQRRDRQRERRKAELERLMTNVDTLWSSPGERAEQVWVTIQQGCAAIKAPLPTGYDLMCFNAEALGKAAIGLNNPELLELTKQLLRWLYTVHYNQPQDVMGPPDKVSNEMIIKPEEGEDKEEDALQRE